MKGGNLNEKMFNYIICCCYYSNFSWMWEKNTCGQCREEFIGTAYTNGNGKAILCDKCATQYWNPFPISEHKYLCD